MKPVIFIDLPKKINNTNYTDLKSKPIEIDLRNKIGKIIKSNELHKINITIESILTKKKDWKKKISKIREQYIYNLQKSGVNGGKYIFKHLNKLKK